MEIHENVFLTIFFSVIVIFGSFEVSFARTKASFPSKAENFTIFNHKSFPPNFAFGASSAAYQYEGAAKIDGRGISVWDVFSHKYPDRITDGTNGDVALDFYHRYKDDIKLMKFIGINSFRFSISWPRVIPTGKISEGVNPKGIAFYNSLINELLANGIQPYVTIFHWDLPQKLQDEYMGILSPKITKDWMDFADLCFREFGNRVKHWATVNEPWNLAFLGHDVGSVPPMRCSAWRNAGCLGGDSGTEPYIAAHQLIISHAHIVKLYREKYKPTQKGQIGIVLNPNWYVPYSNHPADVEAAYRSIDFNYGWFLEPLVLGQYPKTMRQNAGDRLPKFTPEEVELVKGSLDFLGINYYTGNFAKDEKVDVGAHVSSATDIQAAQTTVRNGVPIGEPTGVSIFFVFPDGLEKILVYTKHKYGDVPIYITENGMGQANIDTVEEGINDRQRVRFYQGHLKAVKAAIDQGVNVKGYFGWSFLDTWEWTSGFTSRFGINFVDYKNNLKRHPKLSAMYYKKFLE